MLAAMILHGSDNPPQRSKEQSSVGAYMGTTPRLQRAHQNPESILVLMGEIKRYMLEITFINSIHCIITGSETSLYDFS